MDSVVRSPRMMMIEDTLDDVILAKRLFERCGADGEVAVFKDAETALDYLMGEGAYAGQAAWSQIKLILLDMGLPRLSGLQFLQKLRKEPRTVKLPVVILTVSGMNEDLIQKNKLEISGYLRKPIEMHDFLNCYKAYVNPLVGGR